MCETRLDIDLKEIDKQDERWRHKHIAASREKNL